MSMNIEKLGPIKEAEIKLNKLNLFVGKNGTGKTVASYAIYSFVNWFINVYEAKFFNEANIRKMIIDDFVFEDDVNELVKKFANDAIEPFNNLTTGYFVDFFRGAGIFTPGKSHIHTSEEDLKALVLSENERHGWYCSWAFVASTKDDNLSISNAVENRITSNFDPQTNKVRTFYNVSGTTSVRLSMEDKEKQYNSFIESAKQHNLINLVNRGLKLVLFATSPAYLPAERIGINVFRSQLNTKRLANIQNTETNVQTKVYAKPIEDYITFVNNSLNRNAFYPQNSLNHNSMDIDQELVDKLVPGTFNYDAIHDKVMYNLPDNDKEPIDFELLSSSLKSIFGLDLFLTYSSSNDWLFMDEPEMNLHPINQLYVANFIYQLLKSNVRMVISTHSDYMVKQLINCVLEGKLSKMDLSNKISVYQFENGTVKKLDNIFEINTSVGNFDEVTDKINDKYYDLVDQIEAETNNG